MCRIRKNNNLYLTEYKWIDKYKYIKKLIV